MKTNAVVSFISSLDNGHVIHAMDSNEAMDAMAGIFTIIFRRKQQFFTVM